MDYSKYIQMKMQAANTYKSHWQPRDASEVTLRKVYLAQNTVQTDGDISAARSNIHNGPAPVCCATPTDSALFPVQPPNSADVPINGFSTDYSQDQSSGRIAGNTVSLDAAWGASGGVNLIGCDQVETILTVPANPVKGVTQNCSADPGILRRAYVQGQPVPYTGAFGNIPTGSNATGVAVIYPPYPS